ncbi:MAG: M56 family metallopeptidase [Bacteroidota bacterium]
MTLPFFLAVALKGAVVLALAGLASLLLRHAPASARHGVWAAAFCGLLLLPVLEAVGPRWTVSVLPTSASSFGREVPAAPAPPAPPAPVLTLAQEGPLAPEHGIAAIVAEAAALEAEMDGFAAEMEGFEAEMEAFSVAVDASARAARLDTEAAAVALVATPRPTASLWDRPVAWLLGIWASGVLVVGLLWLSAFFSARRLVRSATIETDEEWAVLGERARRLSGLPGRVRLLRSDRLDVPIAWGYGRPAVVLPASADGWTTERREAVLLHEMAHLRRHDAWTQVLAQAAVALHWANPLAWAGYRRFLDAREQACDDAVLQGGARPSAYAQHLVGVARSLKRDRIALAAVSPMARRVPLESRVCSILDASRRRSSLGRPAFRRALGATLLFLLPLAALRPVAIAQDVPTPPSVSNVAILVDAAQAEVEQMAAVAARQDLAAAEAEMDAAMAEIEASLDELEAAVEDDLAGSNLEATEAAPDRIEIRIDGFEVAVGDALDRLGHTSARLIRLVEGDKLCPEEALAALKDAGLDESACHDALEDVIEEAVQIVEMRAEPAATMEARVEAAAEALASTIVVRASELEAQRAAAVARQQALSFTVRGSTPPRREPSADSASVFDWGAVDRARKDALRRHSTPS